LRVRRWGMEVAADAGRGSQGRRGPRPRQGAGFYGSDRASPNPSQTGGRSTCPIANLRGWSDPLARATRSNRNRLSFLVEPDPSLHLLPRLQRSLLLSPRHEEQPFHSTDDAWASLLPLTPALPEPRKRAPIHADSSSITLTFLDLLCRLDVDPMEERQPIVRSHTHPPALDGEGSNRPDPHIHGGVGGLGQEPAKTLPSWHRFPIRIIDKTDRLALLAITTLLAWFTLAVTAPPNWVAFTGISMLVALAILSFAPRGR